MRYYIVDGSGFLFRAYHAFPVLLDSNGTNVNVVYGFFRILSKLLMEKPDYFVITRDLPVETKRHKIDSEYKANRPAIPNDFKQQIPLVINAVEEIGIPNTGVPGYEADDIIATLTKRFQNECEIVIISSDKDLKQLIDNNVVIKDPMKGNIINERDFELEYGFKPKQMLDYLSLIGDSADNIKGVPGIGPKSAEKLIKKYKTIENIYDNIKTIPDNIKKKLINGQKSAIHSYKMIELMDVDIIHSTLLKDYKLKLDIGKFRQILVNKYHFDSMTKVLDELNKKIIAPTQNSLFG